MNYEVNKKNSIYFGLLKLLLIAALISGGFFALLHYAGEKAVDLYYDEIYQQNKNDEYIARFQKEIDKKNLSVSDKWEIAEWVQNQEVISLQIYKNNILVFDSEYYDIMDMTEEDEESNFYEWKSYYSVDFADGGTIVSIYGHYKYQILSWLMIGELVLSFILFVAIVMLGIRKTIRYIQTLGREIEILEGGNLDYSITVSGQNELSSLARGLDDMRKSFKEKTQNEARMVEANKKIITEMSHDLRTPLTAVMIYSELLSKGKYKDEDQLREYAGKINKKTMRLKQLTDHLFEYSLISAEDEAVPDETGNVHAVFYDIMSEFIGYISQNGFKVKSDLQWKDRKVNVYSEYINRIFDNIASNIIKYADSEKEILVRTEYDKSNVMFAFRNDCRAESDNEESYNIGIENIKKMMEQMGGSCCTDKSENSFSITLKFPLAE
ncbi:MAG: HAMP domain-containing histidine kinase [Firmicutes bacterium]|nr:HAMP domain-containing histidine kinase [Bacillota bacterium]